MTTSPFVGSINDLGLLPRSPAGLDDISVVLAEEERLNTNLLVRYTYLARDKAGWLNSPHVAPVSEAEKNTFRVRGKAFVPIYPTESLELDFRVKIPSLRVSIGSVINREDYLYLVGVTCEVGAEQDPTLGQVEFTYRDENESTGVIEIKPMMGENSRRLRAFTLAVLSPDTLTVDALKSLFRIPATPQVPSHYRLSIARKSEEGFPVQDFQIYAADDNWVEGKSYLMFEEFIDILPVCKVRRTANYTEGGYTDAEETRIVDLILNPDTSQEDIDGITWRRISDILAGNTRNPKRTVQNLTLGSIPSNVSAPGEAAVASNGTNMLANGQRSCFLDQAVSDNISVVRTIAENDGSDRALVSIPLRQTAPFGTHFSEKLSGHKVYSADGQDQSSLGRFSRLGSSGVLAWIAGEGSSIKPGQSCYVVPAIDYPSGSGFKRPFRSIEKVWFNGALLDTANILEGGISDLEAYKTPEAGQSAIAVIARERSGILYIYQDVTVQSNAQGLIAAPDSAGGCFAFVEGIAGRLDKPVVSVPRPNTPYRALVYYMPKASDNWQFLLNYPEYQGQGDRDAALLDGAEIVSHPIFIAHAQGGGNSVYRGESTFRYCPIAKHLPQVQEGIPAYDLYGPIHLALEVYPGPLTMRTLPLSPAAGLAMPMLGQKLSLRVDSSHQMHEKSIRGCLLCNGEVMGFRLPNLSHDYPYQGVVAFAVKKDREVRLLIVTHNNLGGTSAICDSAQNTAFDLFKVF